MLVAAFCTISGAEPTARLIYEKQEEPADIAPRERFYLLLQVDPKGARLAADAFEVTASGDDDQVELGTPNPEAPGIDGFYAKPFVIRIPAKLADSEEHEIKVTLKGKTATGQTYSVEATTDIKARAQGRHVSGKASLKNTPARVGVPNAIVLELTVDAFEYHVYGTEGPEVYGMPMTAELVPTGPETWTGGEKTSPPGKDLEGSFSFELPFTPTKAGKTEAEVLLFWSACTEQLCDPSEIRYLPIAFDVEASSGPVAEVPANDEPLSTAGIFQIILAAIGAGLFALAMPCTYPLIPITISFFTKQAETQKKNVVPLALAYGTGIVVIFVAIGLLVGPPIVAFAARWWVNLIFALLFLTFGLSLIGLFEIRLPAAFNDIAAKVSGTGGYLSVFAMGATLVITSFTCTAPFVGTLLVYAGKGGSLARVGLAMAVFGLTMAIPFVLLSLSPTALQKMPRSGEWMKTIKVTLGIVELGLVLKFLSNVDIDFGWFLIDRELFLVLWAISFLAAALYLFKGFGIGLKDVAGWTLSRGRAFTGAFLLVLTCYLFSGADGSPFRMPGLRLLESFLPRVPEDERPASADNMRNDYSAAFLDVVKEDYGKGVEVAIKKAAPIFLHFTGFN